MDKIHSVGLPDNSYIMCVECGIKIEEQHILDAEEIQSCFYCNRKKIQRF